VNLFGEDDVLEPLTQPSGVTWETMGVINERALQAPLLTLALLLLGLDVLGTLWVSGRLRRAVAATALLAMIMPQLAEALIKPRRRGWQG